MLPRPSCGEAVPPEMPVSMAQLARPWPVERSTFHRTTKTREEVMRSSPWISILLVVSAGLAAQTAAAGPQEDVAAAGQKWGTVFADNNPDTIMPLYAKDGVLWGTLSPTVRSDPGRAEGLFRRRLPGIAEGHRQVRGSVDPGLWRHRGQHRLLHILVHQGRGDQVDPGSLQLHLCEGRQ